MRYFHRLRAVFRLVVERVHGEEADRGAAEIARPAVQRGEQIVFQWRLQLAVGHGETERREHGDLARQAFAAGGIEHEIDSLAAGDRGDARRNIFGASS